MLSEILQDKFSILAIAETKLDDTFSKNQFCINKFKSPYRLDKSKSSGGLLVYVLSDIVSKQLSEFVLPRDFQAITFEINLKGIKWFVVVVYNPYKHIGKVFLDNLSALIDFYLRKYDNIIIIGDMNLQPNEAIMKDFLDNNNLHNLIQKPTCLKSSSGTCIDLILTNKNLFFFDSDTFETGLSDHHVLVHTTFKPTFEKLSPIQIAYRNFKDFDEKLFMEEIMELVA